MRLRRRAKRGMLPLGAAGRQTSARMKGKRQFPDDILAVLREAKGLRILAGTGPDAQTFGLPENSQDVIGKLSLPFHSRTRLAACCSEREHASFGSPSQAHR